MELLFKLLLATHIACGGGSLLLGGYLLIAKKGDKRHKLLGKIYYYTLLAAALISLPMAYIHPNYFLFIIGVFTAYMVATGRNYLNKKTNPEAKPIDWLLTGLMLVFGLAFIVFGLLLLLKAKYFGVVFLVFGFVSMSFVYQDYRNFKGKSKDRNFWLSTHLQRMTASYIASLTAFLVVNNTLLPSILAWLLPTIIIVPLIIKWTNQYQKLK